MPKRPAYAYLRVSTKGQVKGHGFNRQKRAIRDFAKAQGYHIEQFYEEKGISGTTDETQRPAFQAMLGAILGNGIQVVIVESLDRLAREYRIQEQLVIYLASKGVDLFNARTGENVSEAVKGDPLKKALVQIQGVFSELEKNQLVHRLKKGRDRKRSKTGRCEGRPLYGSNPEEQAMIRHMRALRRKQPSGYQRTYAQVADILNAEGHLTRYGKQWSAAGVFQILNRK